MLVSEFNFQLPEELIAQEPLADRAASRMLHVQRDTGEIRDRLFREFPELLREGDLVVFNNTKVFPARLYGHRSGAHAQPVSPRNPAGKEFLQGKCEALLVKQVGERDWEALVRPGRKIGIGERLTFGDELHAEVIARGEFGERTLRFDPVPDFFAAIEHIRHVPLPRPTLLVTIAPPTAIVIRPSMLVSEDPLPHQRRAYTSRPKLSTVFANGKSKPPKSRFMLDWARFSPSMRKW